MLMQIPNKNVLIVPGVSGMHRLGEIGVSSAGWISQTNKTIMPDVETF
jgi:hypothetical protein